MENNECQHEFKSLMYCCDDDYGIHTNVVKGERGSMVLKYCAKCGGCLWLKEKKAAEQDSFQRQLRRFDIKNGENLLEESLLFPAIVQAVNGPYSQFFRFKVDKTKNVKHQQTCPVCGRKLVNLYLKDREWKCKKCLDKEN